MSSSTEFIPTAKMAANAEKGLKLHDEHGRGGTEVGVARARQLAKRQSLSADDIKSIYSYFARHEVDKHGKGWADADAPSAGYIAWLLWGGDEGKTWVDAKRKLLKG